MDNTALDKLIVLYDNQAGLARAMDIDPMAVYRWRENGVPAARCVEIERMTGGKITRQDLRPDLFGLAALEKSA